jgi:C4-type Zn-finger protein
MGFMFTRACPVCGGKDTHPVHRYTLTSKLAWLLAIRPYRCRDCNTRHFGFATLSRRRKKA